MTTNTAIPQCRFAAAWKKDRHLADSNTFEKWLWSGAAAALYSPRASTNDPRAANSAPHPERESAVRESRKEEPQMKSSNFDRLPEQVHANFRHPINTVTTSPTKINRLKKVILRRAGQRVIWSIFQFDGWMAPVAHTGHV